jgi:ankyrin repeat protein
MASRPTKELLKAAERNEPDRCEYYLNQGADIHGKDKDVRQPSESCLRISNFNRCACFQNGDSPLHLASFYGNLEVVRYLLDKGANLEAQNDVFGFIPTTVHTF